MSVFGVREEKEQALFAKMSGYNIREQDLTERFIRAAGKGGQKVNKTSSCVYLKHQPTGLEVKVQRERQQNLNRFLARRLLVQKYEKEILKIKTDDDTRLEKIRKQKKRRKRRASSKSGEVSGA
ncbi:MAG: peptide chain release factor-like protein [Candidatus Omnitrophica bacterium]|nr:peptide chain release factor-like protein [Candidatus Omnitrophota bacterium]